MEDTEFGEIIKKDGGEYKYITRCLRVYTDGGLASYNANEEEWEDEKGNKNGIVSYYNKQTRTSSKESIGKLVARAFIPNPKKLKSIRYKDGNIKNCAVDNLEWGINKKEDLLAVGYRIQNDRYSVRMYDPKTKKTQFYGSFDTQAEAEARVKEVRNRTEE